MIRHKKFCRKGRKECCRLEGKGIVEKWNNIGMTSCEWCWIMCLSVWFCTRRRIWFENSYSKFSKERRAEKGNEKGTKKSEAKYGTHLSNTWKRSIATLQRGREFFSFLVRSLNNKKCSHRKFLFFLFQMFLFPFFPDWFYTSSVLKIHFLMF